MRPELPGPLLRGSAILLLSALVSCATPVGTEDATTQLIGNAIGTPQKGPNELGGFTIGPGSFIWTQIIKGQKECEGAIGSIFPPLSISQCAMGSIARTLVELDDHVRSSAGATPYPEYHAYLILLC